MILEVKYIARSILCKNLDIYDSNQALIDNFQYDSRSMVKSGLFFPLKGENTNGSKYILEIFKKDVSNYSLISKEDYLSNNEFLEYFNRLFIVDNVLESMQILSSQVLLDNPRRIIGITGSNGKTTVKEMIFSLLKENYKVDKTRGNHNSEIGLPYTVLNSSMDANILVLEMGMDHVGEIAKLVKIAPPEIGVITNIGNSHIGVLGSRENIFNAKIEITNNMNEESYLIINSDDDYLNEYSSDKHKIIKVYTDEISNASFDELDKFSFELENCKYYLPIPGEHNIKNFQLAHKVAKLFNIKNEEMNILINKMEVYDNRNSIVEINGVIIIKDYYNASTDSMISAVKTLKNIGKKRKIAILGDMLEQGKYSNLEHCKVGEYSNDKIDILFTIGEAANHIHLCFTSGEKYHFENKSDLIKKLIDELRFGDTVLIKASRGMKFEEISDGISNYLYNKESI